MQNMRIVSCKAIDFDRFVFKTGKGTRAGGGQALRHQVPDARPGRRRRARWPSSAIISRPSPRSAAPRSSKTRATRSLKVSKDGKEIWVQVDTAWDSGYLLTIVEKQAMVQEVVASAELFQSGLKTTGHVEVPGIYFDTGKSELKAESDAAVAEIAKLLKADPALKVYVVGHTDNVASLDLNTKLSQARAEAVVQALVAKHGIAAARLVGRGVGPLAPVASNDAEDGRARNRRVELVKQ